MTDRHLAARIEQIASPRMPAFSRIAAELVDIDSPTSDAAAVRNVQDVLRRELADIGADVELTDTPNGPFLAAQLGPRGRGRVLLVGHADTVFPQGAAAGRPYREDGGIAYGPGVSDMKGCIAMCLETPRALRETLGDGGGEAWLLISPDEEVGSPYGGPLIEQRLTRALASLVLEAGRQDGSIVRSRQGFGTAVFQVEGRAAHAGVEPEKGINAIVETGRLIERVLAAARNIPGVRVSPGVVQGGVRPNVVPPEARLECDIRASDAGAAAQLLEALRQIAAAPTLPGARIAFHGGLHVPVWPDDGSNARLLNLYQEGAAALGAEVDAVRTGGGSDGNRTAAFGVPTLDGLGPIGGLDHSPDEFLDLTSVAPRAALLGYLVARLLNN